MGIVYTYTHREEYYQTVKKDWNIGIFDNTDKTWGHYAKWNKPEKDKYTVISLYWNKKKNPQNKQNQTYKYREQIGGCWDGGWGEG